MKLSVMALLALSLATPVFSGELVTVEGSRITPGSTPPAFAGGGGSGPRNPPVSKPKPLTGDEAGAPPPKKELGGWKIGDTISTDIVDGVLTRILSRSVSAELTVYVEVKDKAGNEYKIWVNIKGSSTTGN